MPHILRIRSLTTPRMISLGDLRKNDSWPMLIVAAVKMMIFRLHVKEGTCYHAVSYKLLSRLREDGIPFHIRNEGGSRQEYMSHGFCSPFAENAEGCGQRRREVKGYMFKIRSGGEQGNFEVLRVSREL